MSLEIETVHYNSHFHHHDFSESDFLDGGFEACALHRAFFLGCQIDYSVFKTNNSAGVCFESAAITNTTFTGDAMPGANFCWAYLRDVTFNNCDLTGADFSKAVFSNVVFNKCTLIYANFGKSNSREVLFISSRMNHAIGFEP